MVKDLLTPDYIFESSWEVCNKVGGIYTVLSTRANTLQEKFRDRIFFIGPDVEDYVICTSHLDHVSSEAQLGQVELITKTMKERYGDSGKPVFLGGDMNATPSSETGKLLQKDWEILTITGFGTFPSDNPSKCIDYIMQLKGTPKCEVVGSQILRWFKSGDVTKASDHLPVMLDIKLPAKNK